MKHFFLDLGNLGEGASGEVEAIALIGQMTAGQINELKAKYTDGIYSVEVDGHVAYFRNPNRKIVNASMSKANATTPLDMFESLTKLTFIGGSGDILTKDDLFLGVCQVVKTKMDGKTAVLVNL